MATHLERLLTKATLEHHPLYASIELTYACNLACRYCYNPIQRKNQKRAVAAPKPTRAPLSYVEIVSLLDQMRDMGVLYLTLTGGEALVHPQFWDIAMEAKKRSFALRVFSNGASIDASAADKLEALMPYCVEMSLHGATSATATALTQVKRSFERQMRALEMLKERGIRVYLKCAVTKLVENELEAIQAIGDRFGYPVYFDPVLTVSDDGQDYPLELQASDQALERLYRMQGVTIGNSPFEAEPPEYNCGVGLGTFHITPYGDIQPCIQWKQPIGNIREMPLSEIWETSPLLMKVREINRSLPTLLRAQGDDHAHCAHCPALSQLRHGDPTVPDEQYWRVSRIRRLVAEESGT